MEQKENIEKGLNKIKYKESVQGWYFKIDIETGQKTEFKQKNFGLYNEMQEWLTIPGNEIEPQFTAEEQAAKDQAETDAAAISWIGELETEYNKDGCTEKSLIVALWERVVEGRPEASDALEVKRQAVKTRIPDPSKS